MQPPYACTFVQYKTCSPPMLSHSQRPSHEPSHEPTVSASPPPKFFLFFFFTTHQHSFQGPTVSATRLCVRACLLFFSLILISTPFKAPNSFGHSIMCTCVCLRSRTRTHPRGTQPHTRTHLLLGGHEWQAVLLRGLDQRIHLAAQRRGETREDPG